MERLSDQVRKELGRFGASAGLADVVARWPEAVGETIARNAWPARIARDGTLHVNTADSVWAFELGQRADEIAGRIGVKKARFAAGPLPSAEPDTAERPAPRDPSPAELAEAAAIAEGIEAETLRESVQKAVLFSLVQGRGDPST